jgi:hypothetical protein
VSTLTQPFTVITVEGPPGQTGPPGNGVFIARETPTEPLTAPEPSSPWRTVSSPDPRVST